MPAYIVVEAAITDGERFGAYAKAVPALVAEYGGDYLVLGGEQHALEGDWTGKRIVIHQWASIEQAQAFWYSDAYTCLLYTSPSPRDMRRSRMPSSA